MFRNPVFQRLRAAFLAGLLLLVPLTVTIWVLVGLGGILQDAIHLVPKSLRPDNQLARSGLGILLALALVLGLGLATRSYLGNQLIAMYERWLARVPIVSTIYGGIKQLLEALFATDKNYFQQVVIVEWPQPGFYAIAFYTGQAFVQREGSDRLVNLFMPTTPNPTTGFFIMLPEDRVIVTDLSVEEAFKLLMSAGIVAPPQRVVIDREGEARIEKIPTEEMPKDSLEMGGWLGRGP